MSARTTLTCLALVLASCASFEPPEAFDEAVLRDRAITDERDGIRSSATLLTPEEIEMVFGLDLGKKAIEPVWLEIENRSEHPVFLIVTALDPEYFAPLEVAHAFHRKFSGEGNAQLDRLLSELAFPNRPEILPGATVSGFVFVNEGGPTHVVDVDLLGEEFTVNMTLFVPNPKGRSAVNRLDLIELRFSAPELVQIEDEDRLRAAVEGLPCCAQDAEGEHVVPLNLVVIGDLDQWASAVLRRGYVSREVAPLYAFQRPQDVAGAKSAKWVGAQAQRIRLWQTPLRYRSAPVWLAQVSSPRGGRFAQDPDVIEPAADRARDDVAMDLFYCQNLAKVGFVKGAGCSASEEAGATTDGLRVLVAFDERLISLAEIGFLDWERLIDYR